MFSTDMSPFFADPARQKTLRGQVQCSGIGLHSGEAVTMRLLPAAPDTGFVFVRTDLKNGARAVKARWDTVVDTRLCTVVGNDHGGKVATIEHLMAALTAAGVDNVTIEIDGPEVPVMDGSADAFVFLLDMAGIQEQNALRSEIRVLKSVVVEEDGKRASLEPSEDLRFSVSVAFDSTVIGAQRHDLVLSKEAFKNEISRARTFGFYEDVERMTKIGLMRGGSLDNAIVIRDEKILNAEGLRFENEFARHKLLDAVGDLALSGGTLKAHFKGVRTGHALNNKLLRALFSDKTAFEIIGAEENRSARAA